MFMSIVVLETAVLAIYSATSYFSPCVIRRILLCSSVCDAALVYYAVFFHVRLLLSDSLVSDPQIQIQAPTSRTTVTRYITCDCTMLRIYSCTVRGSSRNTFYLWTKVHIN